MSTRGAYGFVIGGVTKATYNHSDSYPDGLGFEVAKACGEMIARGIEASMANAGRIEAIDVDIGPTAEQIERCLAAGTVNLSVGNTSTNDWYCLLRDAQGEVSVLFDGHLPYMSDDSKFLKDSLFCEYAYLVNFDTGELEVYKGFNEDWSAPGRYAGTASRLDDKGHANKYAGVALALTIPLHEFATLDPAEAVDRMNEACHGKELATG